MNDANTTGGMSLIVRTAARWLKAFILLFGIYVVVYGHLTPGGGFAGGVVAACAFILLTLACGQRAAARTAPPGRVAQLDSVGALLFLAVAAAGMAGGGAFFRNLIETGAERHFQLFSAGTIPLSNLAIGLKVGMSLLLVFVVLSALRVAEPGGRRNPPRGRGE